MRSKAMRTALGSCAAILAVLVFAVSATAQYGHPLKGSWSGDWGVDDNDRHRLLVVFEWDGAVISGAINPGPNAVPIDEVALDPATWMVHFEAEGTNAAGEPVAYVVDGELQNLGSAHRIITGTWTQGGVTGDFTIRRN